MGMADPGAEIISDLMDTVQEVIPDDEHRKIFYRKLVSILMDLDPDSLGEPCGIDDAYDEVYEEYFPPEVAEAMEDEPEDVFERFEGSWQDDFPDDIEDF